MLQANSEKSITRNEVNKHGSENLSVHRCVDKNELSQILCISVRTIEKESFNIVGRRKMGRSVVYYLPEVLRALELGRPVIVPQKSKRR